LKGEVALPHFLKKEINRMKRYVSVIKNLVIYSTRCTVEFVAGEYTARTKAEINLIEGMPSFGKTIFALEEEEVVEVKEEEPKKENSYVCDFCGEEFTTKQGLNSHSRVHK
jgi:formylmethanofuran dehydrogenase subunit E